ncbi:uncharacterized protein N7459_007261 [Penicillium hispanicum]|uniref:uncharacterized protein n=1 Tax=Penicillium hispanicum TaxID=1080232 RepID=UPI00253FEDE3|nr:uncharacterized protein N7459_007261 [Penicillium hispanicum]KAJ5578297.1 hypothetical protein N7459_007261 [Penicillium hispanicum]
MSLECKTGFEVSAINLDAAQRIQGALAALVCRDGRSYCGSSGATTFIYLRGGPTDFIGDTDHRQPISDF